MKKLRIVGFASSLRRGSHNRRLLERAITAVGAATAVPVEAEVIDLRAYPLPIYDADLQARDGLPTAAQEIHDKVAGADALLVANPEYNGGYPALFKNLVDWVTRVDMFVFHHRYTGLLSATPGKGGGARGIEHTRSLLSNIFVTTHPEGFALPEVHEVLGEDGFADEEWEARLDEWLADFVEAAVAHRDEREPAA